MTQLSRLAVKLRPAAEKAVKQGHPWIYTESISKLNHEGQAGDLAIIFDRRTDKVIAIGLYDPDSPVRIKLIHHGGPEKINAEFFHKKIQAAYAHRKPLLETETNAYRLLFGENDGFPGFIVDVYKKTIVFKLYTRVWFPYLNSITEYIADLTQAESILMRLSRNMQQLETPYTEGEVIYGNLKDPDVQFIEHGVRFKANVLLGHKTGYFLDHRYNRHQVGRMAEDKTVLDVFAYAGGFSVHALSGGAREVTALDISAQALKLASENVELNTPFGKFKTITGDAFQNLRKLIKQNKKYEIVIIDPPAFAKSQKQIPLALKKYAELAELGVQLTHADGLLVLASCSSRVTPEQLESVHREVFHRMKVELRLEKMTQHDIDHPIRFPEGAYLKTIYWRRSR